MNKKKKISMIFILLLVLFEFFRTSFQAVYSLYYIDKGLTISQVSSVKSFQIIAILIFEIPSGYLSDRFGRIKTLYLSATTMGISFIGLLISDSYNIFAISEFIYGIGFALNSGTVMGYVNQYQEENNIHIDNHIMGYTYALMSLGTFISGNIGAYLYNYNIEIPFIISIIGMFSYPLIMAIVFKILKLKDNKANIVKYRINVLSRNILFKNKDIFQASFIYILIFSILFSALSQFIYQYWSVYFVKVLKLDQNIVFSSITIASILGGYIFAKLSKYISLKSLMLLCVCTLALPLIFIKYTYTSAVLSLCMFVFSQFGRGMMFSLNSKIENDVTFTFKNKSLSLSIVGTLTQIFNIISLLIVPYMINLLDFQNMFMIIGIVYLLIIPVVFSMNKKSIIT